MRRNAELQQDADDEVHSQSERTPSEIDVQNEDLKLLTDNELRRCINGAKNRSKIPDLRGNKGRKDLRKLEAELKRRLRNGKRILLYKSIPPPPNTKP
ncbi:MAG: hypothetical protein ACOYUZ_01150 [Patescibacteria group bacterium]